MKSKTIPKKSVGTVQLALDVTPESKELLESLQKKFEIKTKARTLEIILEQAAAREKISHLRERDIVHQMLSGIEFKLDRLLERFEEIL